MKRRLVRICVFVILGAIVNVAVLWERSSELHGIFGPVELIPDAPIWPRSVFNTVFYAGILWLLFAAPFALRRRLRVKRGLCPKCAYDLRGGLQGGACPECGAQVSRGTSVTTLARHTYPMYPLMNKTNST